MERNRCGKPLVWGYRKKYVWIKIINLNTKIHLKKVRTLKNYGRKIILKQDIGESQSTV